MKCASKILAIILAIGSLATFAGCSTKKSAKTSTTANWNTNTSVGIEKDAETVNFWRTHKEVASYEIDLTQGINETYSVTYDKANCSYKTEFYMEEFDWKTDTCDEYKATGEGEAKELVYVFETMLDIKGTYTFKSTKEEKQFNDRVTTVCKYRLAGDNLQPVYSYQQVFNYAPANITPDKADDMYVLLNADYTTYYNRNCTQAYIKTVTNPDNTETKKAVSLTTKEGYSVFDNSQLFSATRSFTKSGTHIFNVCSPQNGATQICNAVCSATTELNSESDAVIINALKNVTDGNGNPVTDYIFFDGSQQGTDENGAPLPAKNIRYNAVTFSILAELKGPSPVYWYASVENHDLNATRSVLLKMQTPLSFNLGTRIYTLNKLSVVEI
ncbi:MAG: hypothetical protein ACI4MS_05020 [Candidatus Coproplasma sp.]